MRAGPDMSKMNGDEYMAVLEGRLAEWVTAHGPTTMPPLLSSFVRDSDVDLVQLPEPEPAPKPRPRRYKPASHWRALLEKLDAEMQGLAEPIITDRAAAGGAALGVRRTRAVNSREDARLEKYAKLAVIRERIAGNLVRAEHREASE